MQRRREERPVVSAGRRAPGEKHDANVSGQEPIDCALERGYDREVVDDVDVVLGHVEHRLVHREAVGLGQAAMHDEPAGSGAGCLEFG